MALEIVEANPNEPFKVLIYGPEGVGKSTFGAMAEKAVFLAPEGGYNRLKDRNGKPVKAIKNVKTFDDIRSAIKSLLTDKHDFKTLVLDSADWVEKAAHAKIGSGKDIIRAAGGYGAGYRESERLHRELIDDLECLRMQRGMNIIVTAHAHIRAAKDPEFEAYDAFEIKCHEFVSSLWREWVEALLFVRFRTYIKDGDDMKKSMAFGDDTRVCYTTKRPAFQAKNRYGMPHEMDFDTKFFSEFEKYASGGVQAETPEQVKSEISDLYLLLNDDKTKSAVQEFMEKAGDDVTKLNSIRKRLKDITQKKGA